MKGRNTVCSNQKRSTPITIHSKILQSDAVQRTTSKPRLAKSDLLIFQAQECAHPKSNFFFEQTQFAVTACGT
jgi:hypothetical protein